MKTILIIGAGKSSTHLIDHLLSISEGKDLLVMVADLSKEAASQKCRNHPRSLPSAISLDDKESRRKLIIQAELVVSMLPAFLHPVVAEDCLELEKHFFTASYESKELRSMASAIAEKGLLFLNECGLDPGIDHMSSMRIIDQEKGQGYEIIGFKSYTGGVLSPESEDNPWKYKFTWNPRNVVLAGQGVSKYITQGQYKFVPYHRLFKNLETIHFKEVGDFDGYPNRDSLSYRSIYGLENIPTMLRGTLRRAGFCESWDVFVQLGMTDDSFEMDLPEGFSMRMFTDAFLPSLAMLPVEEKIKSVLPWADATVLSKLEWLGLFSDLLLPKRKGSPAAILQAILEEKWALKPLDKDMIVMQHQIDVKTSLGIKRIYSSLVCQGVDQEYTAMSKTVGLPLAIAIELFLEGKIPARGLRLPITPDFYEPILDCLEKHGIIFTEEETWI